MTSSTATPERNSATAMSPNDHVAQVPELACRPGAGLDTLGPEGVAGSLPVRSRETPGGPIPGGLLSA